MQNGIWKLRPAVFVLALICFFLPFVTFSCQGTRIASFSGVQMITGTTIPQPQMFGPPKDEKVSPEPFAIMTFACVVIGLALSFLRSKQGIVGSAALAGLTVIFLMALKSKIDSEALRQVGGIIQVKYEAGFYLVILSMLAAICASVFVLLQGRGIALSTFKSTGGSKFCTQCGATNAAADLFCEECGAKFS